MPPKKCLLAGGDAGRGTFGTQEEGLLAGDDAGRGNRLSSAADFRFSIADFRLRDGKTVCAGEGPLAVEDTGQGTSGTRTKTTVGGPLPTGEGPLAVEDTGRGPVPPKKCLLAGGVAHSQSIWIIGNACFSSSIPAFVTRVPRRETVESLFIFFRCTSPASETWVPLIPRYWSAVRFRRRQSPASEILVAPGSGAQARCLLQMGQSRIR